MKLAVAGCTGKMGRAVIEAVLECKDLQLVAALDRAGSADIGRDCGEFLGLRTGVPIVADLDAIGLADVLIDFTRPAASLSHLPVCVARATAVVLGTTGFDAAGRAAIAAAAAQVPLVLAPNMSVGVQALIRLVELGAQLLGDGYDLEIIETHHRDKVDAPSGTALQLGEAAAQARGQSLEALAVFARHGTTGARAPGSIGFSSIRGGDIVGDHTVLFAGNGERIEITHRSSSRRSYALGAVRAARFLYGRAPGQYTMADVLTGG